MPGVIMSVEFFDRHSEAAVISCFVNNYNDCHWMIDMVSPEDFYFGMARNLYKVVHALHQRGVPVDPVSVMGEASSEEIKSAFQKIIKSRHSVKKCRDYIDLIRAHRVRREAAKQATELQASFSEFNAPEEIVGIINKVATDIATLGMLRDQSCVDARAIGESLIERAREALAGPPPDVVGVPSGLHEVDEITSGFYGGDVIIVAGRPSMGKTAFALNITGHVTQYAPDPRPVSVFSLEMSGTQLMQRMQTSCAGVDMNKVRKMTVDAEDVKRLEKAHAEMDYSRIIINDTSSMDIDEMIAILEVQKREFNIGLAIVDYIQLVTPSMHLRRGSNRAEALGDITRKLKKAAMALDIPIIALSQLNRSLESREDKRPMMSDLRESGAIEQDADTIIFLYRDIVYNKSADPTDAEINIAKQRQGPIGVAYVRYDGATTTFRSRKGGGGMVGGGGSKMFSAGNYSGLVSGGGKSSSSPKRGRGRKAKVAPPPVAINPPL